MKFLVIGITLYLMFTTFKLAQSTWQDQNKFAGLFIGFMAFCFPVLLVLYLKK